MKNQETRIQILDAAIDLFWSKSYHSVNMNELSRMAGVNKATVYQYFTSKEDVALAAIERTAERTVQYLYTSTFDETDDPKTQIEQIYQKAFQIQNSVHQADGTCRGCPFVNIGVELATSNDTIRQAVATVFANFRAQYQRIVEAVGDISGDQGNEDLTAALLNNMNGCLIAAKLENRPEAVLDGTKQALRILAL